MASNEEKLKKRLADISQTNPDDWFLVTRARHGMERVFSVLGDQRGSGEVITQAFTCITAVNPIIQAGHTPAYCDINRDTFSINFRLLGRLINPKTRAVVVQHTFGILGDAKGVAAVLKGKKSDALIIEDSAHCLGVLAKSGNKPLADVSVHSFGAEKMLGTRFGGAIWVNPNMGDSGLRTAITEEFKNLPAMSFIETIQVRLYPIINGVLNRLPAGLLKRTLSDVGLFVSPIMPIELTGKNFGSAAKPSESVISGLLEHMKEYDAICAHRAKINRIYFEQLSSGGKGKATKVLPYVRFPLVLGSAHLAESLFKRLSKKGLNPGRWYRPLLFPGAEDSKIYSYNSKSCPVAEDLSERIINLPTGLNVSAAKAKEIIHEINS